MAMNIFIIQRPDQTGRQHKAAKLYGLEVVFECIHALCRRHQLVGIPVDVDRQEKGAEVAQWQPQDAQHMHTMPPHDARPVHQRQQGYQQCGPAVHHSREGVGALHGSVKLAMTNGPDKDITSFVPSL